MYNDNTEDEVSETRNQQSTGEAEIVRRQGKQNKLRGGQVREITTNRSRG